MKYFQVCLLCLFWFTYHHRPHWSSIKNRFVELIMSIKFFLIYVTIKRSILNHFSGARVILACRDIIRANNAVDEIKAETKDSINDGELLVKQLDLGSLESVRECAKDILASEEHIHLLVNNAGLLFCIC